MLRYVELIAAGTGGATSDRFDIRGIQPGGATLVAKGLAGTETVVVQNETDGAGTYADLYLGGAIQQLKASTDTSLNLVGPNNYKVVKSATAGNVSVGIVYSDS
jgi:hypothetical protein